jgi:hypothetical protein
MPTVYNPEGKYFITTPPASGSYGYYDSRLFNINDRQNNADHYFVKTERFPDRYVACHYSLTFQQDPEPFITCQGKIIKIKSKEVKNN